MKRLDAYILNGFIFSFLVVFLSMVALSIMVDVVVNLDEFLEEGGEAGSLGAWQLAGHMARYYFFRTFEYFQMLCGAAMLVGAAFAVARLNKHNELVAFIASGVSVYRLLWPLIVAGVVISGLYVLNQELVLPGLIDQLIADRAPTAKSGAFPVKYVRDGRNSLIFAPSFDPSTETMEAAVEQTPDGDLAITRRVTIAGRDPKTDENRWFIEAERAEYDAARGGWRLMGGKRWSTHAGDDLVVAEEEPIDFYETDLTPEILWREHRRNYQRFLSFAQLYEILHSGSQPNPAAYEVTMHQHFARPLLNLVILLMGLPFVVGYEGKSYFISISICIGLFVLVLGTDYVATEFGSKGHIPPILGAYLPVLLFAPVAVLSMDGVRT